MTLRCRDRARHQKFGLVHTDDVVAWCEACSPQDEPHAEVAHDDAGATESGVDFHTRLDTHSTDEALLKRVLRGEVES